MDTLCKCKVDSITSPLYGVMSWTAKLPISLSLLKIPNQPPPNKQDNLQLQVGLKTLIHSQAKQPNADHDHVLRSIVHCYTSTTTSKSSSPPTPISMFRCCVMDDLIGTESGDSILSFSEEGDLKVKGAVNEAEPLNNGSRVRVRHRSSVATRREREYPPPIPLLAHSGNFGGRNPWVLKREYSEGRLIVRAERVKHHENLEAHRENGRLVMKLVPVDSIAEDAEFKEEGCDTDELEEELRVGE